MALRFLHKTQLLIYAAEVLHAVLKQKVLCYGTVYCWCYRSVSKALLHHVVPTIQCQDTSTRSHC